MKVVVICKASIKPLTERWLRQNAQRITAHLNKAKLSAAAHKALRNATELRLIFISSAEMRRLNNSFRGRDYATDILSFANSEAGVLGELVMALPVLKRQARENDHSLQAELTYMILHGVLHLVGYDHETNDKAATRMYRLQDAVFSKMSKARKK